MNLPGGGDDDPFVTVEAGTIRLRGGWITARYFVDRATRTCWLLAGDSLGAIDCCAARRVEAMAPLIDWETDASCATPRPEEPATSAPPENP